MRAAVAPPPGSYQRSLIVTCFMAPNPIGGDRLVRSAARRDMVCRASGATRRVVRPRSLMIRAQAGINSPPGAPLHDRGRSACGALHPQIGYWGTNRSCPVANFSPVKQATIRDRWYLGTNHLPGIATAIFADRASRSWNQHTPRIPFRRNSTVCRTA